MRNPAEALVRITEIDAGLWAQNLRFAGVDEAGRGPLCGPVVAACVVMPAQPLIVGVNDSKKLSGARREALYEQIMQCALFVGIGEASVAEIDAHNILQATKLAMQRAAENAACDLFLVDGNQHVVLPGKVRLLVGGDACCYSVAAASIVAKVERDRMMREYDAVFPGYGMEKHKGYGTAEHVAAIRALGPCPIHRRSFLRKILRDGA